MHWLFDAIGGLALFALGFIVGGTVAFYKGWDEGFREGYDNEVRENAATRLNLARKAS